MWRSNYTSNFHLLFISSSLMVMNRIRTVPRRWRCCGLLLLSWVVPFPLVLDFLYALFRIAWERVSSWLSTCVYTLVLCHTRCPFLVFCSLPVWCLWQDVEFDWIGSWSFPSHLLSVIVHSTIRCPYFSIRKMHWLVLFVAYLRFIYSYSIQSFSAKFAQNSYIWPRDLSRACYS